MLIIGVMPTPADRRTMLSASVPVNVNVPTGPAASISSPILIRSLMCRETAPRSSRLMLSSTKSRSFAEDEIEYERIIRAPPTLNATLRNWPGTNVKARGPSPTEARRNVLTAGVSSTMRATRRRPRHFAVTGADGPAVDSIVVSGSRVTARPQRRPVLTTRAVEIRGRARYARTGPRHAGC